MMDIERLRREYDEDPAANKDLLELIDKEVVRAGNPDLLPESYIQERIRKRVNYKNNVIRSSGFYSGNYLGIHYEYQYEESSYVYMIPPDAIKEINSVWDSLSPDEKKGSRIFVMHNKIQIVQTTAEEPSETWKRIRNKELANVKRRVTSRMNRSQKASKKEQKEKELYEKLKAKFERGDG